MWGVREKKEISVAPGSSRPAHNADIITIQEEVVGLLKNVPFDVFTCKVVFCRNGTNNVSIFFVFFV